MPTNLFDYQDDVDWDLLTKSVDMLPQLPLPVLEMLQKLIEGEVAARYMKAHRYVLEAFKKES